MMRWQPSEEVAKTTSTSGVTTGTVISNEWAHYGDPCLVRVDVVLSAVTHAGTQTLVLEQLVGGSWVTLQSKAFTTTGTQTFIINTDTSFKAVIPVAGRMRLSLVQDNAGDAATVSSIMQYQWS